MDLPVPGWFALLLDGVPLRPPPLSSSRFPSLLASSEAQLSLQAWPFLYRLPKRHAGHPTFQPFLLHSSTLAMAAGGASPTFNPATSDNCKWSRPPERPGTDQKALSYVKTRLTAPLRVYLPAYRADHPCRRGLGRTPRNKVLQGYQAYAP